MVLTEFLVTGRVVQQNHSLMTLAISPECSTAQHWHYRDLQSRVPCPSGQVPGEYQLEGRVHLQWGL